MDEVTRRENEEWVNKEQRTANGRQKKGAPQYAGHPKGGGDLLSHLAAVPSARLSLTILFGMGRGGASAL